jgi:prolipoprotein diacylglyceryl transferase
MKLILRSPVVVLLGRRISIWRFCAALGALCSLLLWPALSAGLPGGARVWVVAANLAAFISLNELAKWRLSAPRTVMLEHLLLCLTVSSGVLFLSGASVLHGLDAWAVSLLPCLTLGRMGCFLGGCCHGRPAASGVRYTFRLWPGAPPPMERVWLAPVQAHEACWLGFLLLSSLPLPEEPGGLRLAWVVGGYALGRFGLEFLRGDARPYVYGLSESQWLSLGLLVGAAWLAWRLEFGAILPVAAAALGTLLYVGRSRLGRPLAPLRPGQVAGLLAAARRLADVRAVEAPGGLSLSIADKDGGRWYEIWGPYGRLDAESAALVVALLQSVAGPLRIVETLRDRHRAHFADGGEERGSKR